MEPIVTSICANRPAAGTVAAWQSCFSSQSSRSSRSPSPSAATRARASAASAAGSKAHVGRYARRVKTFNLRSVRLRSGEEFRDEIQLELGSLEYGGQRYLPVPDTVPAALAISRASTGTVFELRFDARLHGPCYRCLADAVVELSIDAREYQATNPEGSDELRTPYLVDDKLDVNGWARDAIALALPEQILCRPDCAGLCPECGKDLNLEPHAHE